MRNPFLRGSIAVAISAMVMGCASTRDPYEKAVSRVKRELSVMEADYRVHGVQWNQWAGGSEVEFVEGDYRDKAAVAFPKRRTVRIGSIDRGRDSVIEVTAVDAKLLAKRRNREAEREFEDRFLPDERDD